MTIHDLINTISPSFLFPWCLHSSPNCARLIGTSKFSSDVPISLPNSIFASVVSLGGRQGNNSKRTHVLYGSAYDSKVSSKVGTMVAAFKPKSFQLSPGFHRYHEFYTISLDSWIPQGLEISGVTFMSGPPMH